MNFLYGVLLLIFGQVLTFFQIQGHLKYDFFKNNQWFSVLLGIPISIIFMVGINMLIRHYGGALWPSRIIGFSIGTIVYAVMSHYLFSEQITIKTLICLSLSVIIVLVQVFWKE
jgi:hypothetical protein